MLPLQAEEVPLELGLLVVDRFHDVIDDLTHDRIRRDVRGRHGKQRDPHEDERQRQHQPADERVHGFGLVLR